MAKNWPEFLAPKAIRACRMLCGVNALDCRGLFGVPGVIGLGCASKTRSPRPAGVGKQLRDLPGLAKRVQMVASPSANNCNCSSSPSSSRSSSTSAARLRDGEACQ